MPKGFSGVRHAKQKADEKREAMGTWFQGLYFALEDGETANVRFLEENDEIVWCHMHEIPIDGRQYPVDVPCLDQDDEDEPCPGCEGGFKRKFKGFINLIWEDAPVYKRDQEKKFVKDNAGRKKVVGTETQVAVWTTGINVFDTLDELNDSFGGLKGVPMKVTRRGIKLNTKYKIRAANPKSPYKKMSREELEFEDKKYDLAEIFTTPPTYDEFERKINGTETKGYASDDRPRGASAAKAAKKNNPFMKRK